MTGCLCAGFGDIEAELMEDDDEEEEEEDEEDEEEDEDDLEEEEEDGAEAAGATTASSGGCQSGELDRSLELHLGNVLENEFSEVLSKLPDEAFTELFAGEPMSYEKHDDMTSGVLRMGYLDVPWKPVQFSNNVSGKPAEALCSQMLRNQLTLRVNVRRLTQICCRLPAGWTMGRG